MGKSTKKVGVRYTPEFRRQMVELVRAGRKASELAREFAQTQRGQIYFFSPRSA